MTRPPEQMGRAVAPAAGPGHNRPVPGIVFRMRQAVLTLLGTLLIFAATPATAHADELARARKHAQRANHLAAMGKCKQALAEFDRAMLVLRDPALLFNRGECHRKVGDGDAAIADYAQFLHQMPNAPNRTEVESRIAELRSSAASGPHAESPASGAAMDAQAHRRGTSSGGKGVVVPAAPSASTTHASGGPVEAPSLAELPGVSGPGDEGAPAAGMWAAPAATVSGRSTAAQKADESWATKPWFLVAVGAVLVGAGITTLLVWGHEETTIPASDLGNYKF